MKIAIIGSGIVGQVLGRGFSKLGYQVMMGSRDPNREEIQTWVESTGENASAGILAEAATFGDMAVLATSWNGAENAVQLAGPRNFAGKVVMDATNPLDFSTGAPALAVGGTDSAGEQVQRWLPDARVVKAFNTVGNSHMVNPDFPGGPPDMFICGNDADAKRTVTGLSEALGWSVIDFGGIERARYLEPLAMVWILHAVDTNSRDHAFKLLKK